MSVEVNSSYHEVFDSDFHQDTVKQFTNDIRKFYKKTEFTHMVVTGLSGQSIAWPIAYLTGIPIVVLRKRGEKSHSYSRFAGDGHIEKYIIIDDFIESGKTIKRILSTIEKNDYTDDGDPPAECIGIFLYNSGEREDFVYKKKKIPIFTSS